MTSMKQNFIFTIFLFISLFITGCNHLFYYPDSNVRTTPDKFNLKYDEILIKTKDGETLSGWFIHSKNTPPIATILHFHGNAENMTSHFFYLSWLTNKGFDIIEFDYRGYGASSGKPSRDGLFEDGKAALSWAREHAKTETLFIIAQSLGGAVVIPAYAKNPIHGVAAIIIDSSFASYRKIAREKLSDIWLTWPLQWPLSFLISDDLSPIDSIQEIPVPLLFIHNPKDPVVPFDAGHDLFTAALEPKEFWEIPWDGHCSAFVNKDDLYRKKLVNFLCNHLKKPQKECDIKANAKYIDLKP